MASTKELMYVSVLGMLVIAIIVLVVYSIKHPSNRHTIVGLVGVIGASVALALLSHTFFTSEEEKKKPWGQYDVVAQTQPLLPPPFDANAGGKGHQQQEASPVFDQGAYEQLMDTKRELNKTRERLIDAKKRLRDVEGQGKYIPKQPITQRPRESQEEFSNRQEYELEIIQEYQNQLEEARANVEEIKQEFEHLSHLLLKMPQ
jgi:hypothetical protein